MQLLASPLLQSMSQKLSDCSGNAFRIKTVQPAQFALAPLLNESVRYPQTAGLNLDPFGGKQLQNSRPDTALNDVFLNGDYLAGSPGLLQNQNPIQRFDKTQIDHG